MLLDIRRVFAGSEVMGEFSLNFAFSGEDFPGYRIEEPVQVCLKTQLFDEALNLELCVKAKVLAECARCLEPITQEIEFTKSNRLRIEDLLCEDPEFPVTNGKKLDIKELVYTELVLEVPTVLLCSEICEGLCQVCGKRKDQGCTCNIPHAADQRFKVLETLLS